MSLTDAARSQALALLTSARRDLADLGGLLALQVGGTSPVPVRIPTAEMAPVPGVANVWWLQLPCARPDTATCTRLIVGGLAGALAELVRVPHAVTLKINEGVLRWWQEGYGYNPDGSRAYRRHEVGEVLRLAENEPHGFEAQEDFLLYNTFSPRFTEPQS